jgi:DNA modification methylase
VQQKLIVGDAVNVLKTVDSETVRLTVTSPPYDTLRTYGGIPPLNFGALAEELYRVTAPGGVLVWVVNDETKAGGRTGTCFRQALAFQTLGFTLFDTMIYQKTGTSFPAKNRYTPIFDFMFVFCKGKKPKTVNLICDVPKLWAGSWGTTTQRSRDGSLKASTAKTNRKATVRAEDGRYGFKSRTNIWRIANGKKFAQPDGDLAYKHPATFPYALPYDHIRTWTREGELVLDPMAGSGTTPLAAHVLRRQYVAIDVMPESVALMKKRVDKYRREYASVPLEAELRYQPKKVMCDDYEEA